MGGGEKTETCREQKLGFGCDRPQVPHREASPCKRYAPPEKRSWSRWIGRTLLKNRAPNSEKVRTPKREKKNSTSPFSSLE